MTALDVQGLMVEGLTDYLGVPVILSDQVQPEPGGPFVTYTPLAPYISRGALGEHRLEAVEGAGGEPEILDTRIEHADGTFSFVACSSNRVEGGRQIYGDTEAQALAEQAQGWFLHVGYEWLSHNGVVVVEVMNAGSRTTLEVDEAARRYGFDVRARYARTDVRRVGIVQDYNVNRSERNVD